MYIRSHVSIKLEEKLYSVLSSSHLYARSAALVSVIMPLQYILHFSFRESHSTSSFPDSFHSPLKCQWLFLIITLTSYCWKTGSLCSGFSLAFILQDFIHLYIICVLSPLESIFLIIKVYFSKMLRMYCSINCEHSSEFYLIH